MVESLDQSKYCPYFLINAIDIVIKYFSNSETLLLGSDPYKLLTHSLEGSLMSSRKNQNIFLMLLGKDVVLILI